jgi:hypothetical protein
MLPAIFKGNPEIVIRKKEVFLSSRHSEGVNPPRNLSEKRIRLFADAQNDREKRRFFGRLRSLRRCPERSDGMTENKVRRCPEPKP